MSYTTGIVSLLEVEDKAPKVLSLTYEADLCSLDLYNQTMKKLERFLGLTPAKVTPRLPVKQHVQGLSDLVLNWDEPYIQEIARKYARLPTTCAKPKPDLDALFASLDLGFRDRRRLGDADARHRRRLETERRADGREYCIEGREEKNKLNGF